jgi:hypothetical protein
VVAEIVDKALMTSKKDRWPNAREMRDAVKNARESLGLPSSFSAVPPSVAEMRVAGLAQTVESRPGVDRNALIHATTHLQATTPVEAGARASALPTSTPGGSTVQRRSPRVAWTVGGVVLAVIAIAAIAVAMRPRPSAEVAPTSDSSLATQPSASAAPSATPSGPSVPEVAPATTEDAVPVASETAKTAEPAAPKPKKPPPRPTGVAKPPTTAATTKPPDGTSMFDKR